MSGAEAEECDELGLLVGECEEWACDQEWYERLEQSDFHPLELDLQVCGHSATPMIHRSALQGQPARSLCTARYRRRCCLAHPPTPPRC